jgi:hypothetical protein
MPSSGGIQPEEFIYPGAGDARIARPPSKAVSVHCPTVRLSQTLREFLPVSEKLNHVTLRNRALRAGLRIDSLELTSSNAGDSETQWTLAIDGGFVRQ